jgi:DnaK suppressor protein
MAVGGRRDDIRRMLVERRRELLNEIQNRVWDVREAGSNTNHHTTDLADTVEAEPEDDLVFALIQLTAEMLERVDEAVRHFDEGTYGYCVDCGEVIASARLRAMPLQCVVGIARGRARTSSTASASSCSECRQASARDTEASSVARQRHRARQAHRHSAHSIRMVWVSLAVSERQMRRKPLAAGPVWDWS